jgi:hypothetical protein
VLGTVCRFCGRSARRLDSPEEEAEAIAELHQAVGATAEDAAKARLLANGPLPDDPGVLIDAGLRCIQLMEPSQYLSETAKAAKRRAEVVVVKLRVLPEGDPRISHAIREIDAQVKSFADSARRQDRTFAVLGIGCFVAIGALLAAVVYYLVR